MFLLKKVNGNGVFHLFPNSKYVVGRKNADILIEDDASISRKHAVISVLFKSATITDCASKYGTRYNNSMLTANTDTLLKDMDEIHFGVYNGKYRFETLKIVTVSSGLSDAQKKMFKQTINMLSGTVLNNWNSTCTHLTAEEMVLSIKVLLALVDNKPIVTTQYWHELSKSIQNKNNPPKVEDFQPKLSEMLINKSDIVYKPERRELFKGQSFVFITSKIAKKMEDLITLTGGSSLSWESQPLTVFEVSDSMKNYIFIEGEENSKISPNLQQIHQHLRKMGQRTIPIQEIAMAIIKCSCQEHCNPKFNRTEKVLIFQPTQIQSEAFVLAPETPQDTVWDYTVTKKEVVIPESLEGEHNFSLLETQLEKRMNSDVEKNPPKRMKIELNKIRNDDLLCRPSISGLSKQTEKNIRCSKKTDTDINKTKNQEIWKKSDTGDVFSRPSTSEISNQKIVDSKKRKSEEDLWFVSRKPKERKTIVKHDPDNPFLHLKTKQEVVEPDNFNPFLQAIQNREEFNSSQSVKEKTYEVQSVISICEDYFPSNNSHIDWISTDEIKVVKDELHGEVKEEFSFEYKEIFERFKDTVVIEVISLASLQNRSFQSRSFSSTPSSYETSLGGGRKNFKKFKKVRPLRPQTTILRTSVHNENIGSDGEDEDLEEDVLGSIQRNPVPTFDF